MSTLFAEHALLPSGWARNVLLVWDADGVLSEVRPGSASDAKLTRAAGPVLPGMPNLHSHAFQRAMVGLTEWRAPGENDFWSWRELMYRFALTLSAEELEAVAAQLYIEMLKCGYTSVCEFHYLHHDEHGQLYANKAELSERLVSAAGTAGIGLTLLPTLYQHSSFGQQPPLPEQRRFVTAPEFLLDLLAELRRTYPQNGALRYGIAPHSLRAVDPQSLARLVAAVVEQDPSAPVHIHVAEQTAEIAGSVAAFGVPPVAWLLDHAEVDGRWCLVHGTQMSPQESARAARSGATLCLCPTTEANLGDGLFDVAGYLAAGGAWGIGSDSQVSVSPREELRWLEYGQRLVQRRRNVLAGADTLQVAQRLFLQAVAGGARASGRDIAGLAVGQRADLVVLDADSPDCSGADPSAALSAWIFGNHGAESVRDVMVGGRWAVQEGHHLREDQVLRAYRHARESLLRR